MCPQTFESVLVRYGGGHTEQNSLDDSGKVSQVEEVVGFGRCGQEVAHCSLIHIHGGCHNLHTSGTELNLLMYTHQILSFGDNTKGAFD